MVKKITIAIADDLIRQIDAAAKADYTSRSDYIRRATIARLKAEQTG